MDSKVCFLIDNFTRLIAPMEATILTCPFMEALNQGRHEDLHRYFDGFKTLVQSFCKKAKHLWHEAHLSLCFIQEEVLFFAEEAQGKAARYIKRALLVIQMALDHLMQLGTLTQSGTVNEKPREGTLQSLGSAGDLSKNDIVMLGHAIHAKSFRNTDINIEDICTGLGGLFGVSISGAYSRTAFTDSRNRYEDGKKLFTESLSEALKNKVEAAIEVARAKYDEEVRRERDRKTRK